MPSAGLEHRAGILIVEDDPALLDALTWALRGEGYDVTTAVNGEEALDLVAESTPDLIVMDVMMPVMDGLQTCRVLRARGYGLPVLMLSARDGVSDRVCGLDSGAQDYVTKPYALEELLARVRALVRDRTAGDPLPLHFEDITLDEVTRRVFRGERELVLTKSEFELLREVLQNPLRVLTREALQTALWGESLTAQSNLLDVLMSSVRRKLEEQGELRLIQTVRGVGFVLRQPAL